MKKVGQMLSTNIMQPIFHGMIEFVVFEILHEGLGGFIVIRKSIHENKT
jgi:hypothetical protein